MKKKIKNDEVGKVIGKLAEQVRSEMDYEFRVAHSQMCIAESDLVETFNEKQRALYNEFYKKREEFFYLAREIYKRKF